MLSAQISAYERSKLQVHGAEVAQKFEGRGPTGGHFAICQSGVSITNRWVPHRTPWWHFAQQVVGLAERGAGNQTCRSRWVRKQCNPTRREGRSGISRTFVGNFDLQGWFTNISEKELNAMIWWNHLSSGPISSKNGVLGWCRKCVFTNALSYSFRARISFQAMRNLPPQVLTSLLCGER